jgi:hypothetical protein
MDSTASVHQISSKSRKTRVDDYGNDRQAFREESMSRTLKIKLTETAKGETGKEQSQEHAHHFL